ncbi:MAG: hypothetical protein AAGD32_11150 [Planctomycetota bacterium]
MLWRFDGAWPMFAYVGIVLGGLGVAQQIVAIMLRRIAADGHDTGDGYANIAQASKLLENEQLEWVERKEHEMVALPGVDIRWCNAREAELVEAGFRRLGHLESLAATRQWPSMRSIVRVLVRPDGTSAAIYDVKVRGLMRVFVLLRAIPNHIRTVEIETEFDDGTFLLTNNCAKVNLMDAPSVIHRKQHPTDKPVGELLVDHDERLAERLNQAGVAIRPVRTMRDGIGSQMRMDALKSKFRKQVGPLTDTEAERFVEPYQDESAEELQEKLRAAADKR